MEGNIKLITIKAHQKKKIKSLATSAWPCRSSFGVQYKIKQPFLLLFFRSGIWPSWTHSNNKDPRGIIIEMPWVSYHEQVFTRFSKLNWKQQKLYCPKWLRHLSSPIPNCMFYLRCFHFFFPRVLKLQVTVSFTCRKCATPISLIHIPSVCNR